MSFDFQVVFKVWSLVVTLYVYLENYSKSTLRNLQGKQINYKKL